MRHKPSRRHQLSGIDRLKFQVVHWVSLLGFLLFSLAYAIEQVRHFLEKLGW